IGIADLVQPGSYLPQSALDSIRDAPLVTGATSAAPSVADLPELLIDLLPGNPLNAMVEGQMLQVVLFAVVVGIALVSMPAATARPLLDLLGSLQEVCMTVVRWAMLLAPVAVFGLVAQLASRTGVDVMLGVGVYVLTVIAGLACMLAIYALLLRFALAVPVGTFFRNTREVLLLAFSTSSSAAVMPLSIKTAQETLGIRPSVAQFVIPLGATINMNGTALYQAVAASFLAQVFGVELGLSGTTLIVAMTVGASIGSPATPGVGIVILAMVLEGIGVPAAGIALIMGVDRILDMCRTAVNVAGDLVASYAVDRWAGGPTSAAEELSELAALASVRETTGQDTLITDDVS
ncbi:MAG: dicarboxylate/amino acid:cation symporter, partial [Gammaproteobacteria bacterium]